MGRKGDAPGVPKADGSPKWRAVDCIWMRVETKVTDGRSASVAESSGVPVGRCSAMSSRRVECVEVADGRSASAAESGGVPVGRCSAKQQEERVPSAAPCVVHQPGGFDPQEWTLLGVEGVAVSEQKSSLGLVTAGAAKAKVVTAGSLAWISQALSLLEEVGASYARAYEHTA